MLFSNTFIDSTHETKLEGIFNMRVYSVVKYDMIFYLHISTVHSKKYPTDEANMLVLFAVH